MKSKFNYDMLINSLIGAIGYGLGFAIPNLYNLPMAICIICCFVLGLFFDFLAKKISLIKTFRNSKKGRITLIVLIYLSYLIAWIIVNAMFDYDLDYDLFMNLGFILLYQLVSFIINLIRTKYINSK